jgi:hypothetical protein
MTVKWSGMTEYCGKCHSVTEQVVLQLCSSCHHYSRFAKWLLVSVHVCCLPVAQEFWQPCSTTYTLTILLNNKTEGACGNHCDLQRFQLKACHQLNAQTWPCRQNNRNVPNIYRNREHSRHCQHTAITTCALQAEMSHIQRQEVLMKTKNWETWRAVRWTVWCSRRPPGAVELSGWKRRFTRWTN